jgi:hypothetical protein
MKTTLRTDITVKDICEGFIYSKLEGKGLFGLSGKLTIQPEYQRNYIYADGKTLQLSNQFSKVIRSVWFILTKLMMINLKF